jgi:MraZ protein
VFFGTYHHRLNSKNQVTVPSRLRDAVDTEHEGRGFYLFAAERDCLYLFTPRGMEEVVERARAGGGAKRQDFLRMLYASVVPVECDGQGRIVLPGAMKKAAGIDKDLVFVGAHRRIELWNPDRWTEYSDGQRQEFGQKLDVVVEDVFGL